MASGFFDILIYAFALNLIKNNC